MIPIIGKAIISKLADKAGISIGAKDGGPFPTVDQLKTFAIGAAEAAINKLKEKDAKKFTYGVGSYWPDGGIGLYAYGSDTFHGTIHDAKEFLEYVKKQNPEKEYHIFMLVELPV